ncbi:MAG: DUF2905 domain-containing protein [Verrucomicrobia bacterium]|nr:DUF2905 domain-containing protein [Verrucomicrobiota bacterium]
MEPLAKWIILTGLALAALGGLIWLLGTHGGRFLPGDIAIEKGNFRFYFPIVTCLALSLLLTLLFTIFNR